MTSAGTGLVVARTIQVTLPDLNSQNFEVRQTSGSRSQSHDVTGVQVDVDSIVSPDEAEKADPGVVKAVLDQPGPRRIARARDFCRLLPPDHTGPQFHHIGIYAYRRTAIDTFIRLPPTARETERRLEQMRALDAGMRIDAALVDTVPIGVDTPADLEQARSIMDGDT